MHTMHDVASDFVWRIRMPRDSKREYREGGIGIFGFGYFFRSVFRFLCQTTSVFRFFVFIAF